MQLHLLSNAIQYKNILLKEKLPVQVIIILLLVHKTIHLQEKITNNICK